MKKYFVMIRPIIQTLILFFALISSYAESSPYKMFSISAGSAIVLKTKNVLLLQLNHIQKKAIYFITGNRPQCGYFEPQALFTLWHNMGGPKGLYGPIRKHLPPQVVIRSGESMYCTRALPLAYDVMSNQSDIKNSRTFIIAPVNDCDSGGTLKAGMSLQNVSLIVDELPVNIERLPHKAISCNAKLS